jgi:hypothetical protein
MHTDQIVAYLDEEIGKLTKVKNLLEGGTPPRKKSAFAEIPYETGKPKRVMSPEGRASIAAAQKKRWAKQKHAA